MKFFVKSLEFPPVGISKWASEDEGSPTSGLLEFEGGEGLESRFLEEIKCSKKGIGLEDGWKSSGGNEDRKARVNNNTLRNGLKKWEGRDSSLSVKRLVMKTKYSNVNFKVSWNLEEAISKIIETCAKLSFDFKGNKVKMVDIMAVMMRKLMLGGGS
ncbi:hypothetical protein LWI29_012950 [Acer saccharum]|uniref:Uncharacterized protein n=1 Tax=Acer saccharum TaxID=4024 RepID=A0AA39SSY7_ACESA|nr:hypothetical protein LWI29_012950 [Acer saccharum]